MPVDAGSRLGPYEIVGPLGAGGMGEVYRARDPRLGREVAVKVLPGDFAGDTARLRRFELEARATAALNHPGILSIHDVGMHDGRPYFVTELLEGATLRERLRDGRLGTSQAIELSVQIARALSAAHEKGIVHRDLKPENLFLTADGRIKILDFGLAKLIEPDASGPHALDAGTETVSGVVLGTVGYMAPEQARGKPCDARADIFALGCVLYEMLSGKRAFRGETAADTISAILHADPPPLVTPFGEPVPAMQAIVSRCLRKPPEDRFSTARDLAFALEQVSGPGRPISSVPTTAPTVSVASGRSKTGRRSRRKILIAGGALLFVAVLAAGWLWRARGGAAGGPVRLAVLPFENLSGDPGQEYLSDGLTQEMISQLGRLHPATLSVIARTSVMRFKKTDKPVDEIGRALNVDYVLEGSARREGNRVRITAELVQVKGQAQLWSDSFERDLSGILALQNDVSQKVARALALKLLSAEQARLANARSVNPEAYEAYLKGLHHWYKLTSVDLDTSLRYFEVALTRDPDYAMAHAGIALVWVGRSTMGVASPTEAGPKARTAAQRAIELDDTIAETHHVLALVRTWTDWDWEAGEREFRRSIELNPSFPDARAYYSQLLMQLSRPREALVEVRKALELDPFNSLFHIILGFDLLYARRWDDTIAEAQFSLKSVPGDPAAHGLLWFANLGKGRLGEAVAGARGFMKVYGDPRIDAAFEKGEKEGGDRLAMARAAEALATLFRESYANPTDVASLWIGAGDHSQAMDWLEKGYEVRDQSMPCLGLPVFDPLRSNPRFQALVKKMNLPVR